MAARCRGGHSHDTQLLLLLLLLLLLQLLLPGLTSQPLGVPACSSPRFWDISWK